MAPCARCLATFRGLLTVSSPSWTAHAPHRPRRSRPRRDAAVEPAASQGRLEWSRDHARKAGRAADRSVARAGAARDWHRLHRLLAVSLLADETVALRVLTERAFPNLCTSGLLPEESFTDCKLVARRPPDLLSDSQLQKEQGKKPPQDEYTSVRVKKLKRGSSPETNKLIDYLVRRSLVIFYRNE